MKKMKRLLALLLAVLLLFSLFACGKDGNSRSNKSDVSSKTGTDVKQSVSPILWHATDKEGREIYFFGTIHIGDKRNKEVIKQLHPVLQECDALAVEMDTVAYSSDLSAQQRDLMEFVYSDGTTIRDHISDELYEKLESILRETKLYLKIYDNYKLGLWYQLISQAIIKKSGLSANKAMENLLINDANSIDLEILEVESAEFQNKLIADTPDDYYRLVLGVNLDRIDDSVTQLQNVYSAWLKGDEDELYGLLSDEYVDLDFSKEDLRLIEEYDRKLLTDRNIGMAEKAKEYVKSGKKVFFAVGAAHFFGEDGIVSLLEDEGFTFEKVQY